MEFSAEIGLRHFSTLGTGYLVARYQKKVMTGSMRTFVTDGQTDGRPWIHRTQGRVHKARLSGGESGEFTVLRGGGDMSGGIIFAGVPFFSHL